MSNSAKETIPVRPGEELDLSTIALYLRNRIDGLGEGPLEVEQFSAGHSNLTYLLRCGQWEGVLRRPPLGPVAPKAHDMVREANILKRIHPIFPLAPKPYVICEDETVMGCPFYVMERRHGVVLDHSFPPGAEVTEDLCRDISYSVVDTLVSLHSVDYREAGLGDFGYPDGYMQRQVNGWIGRYERSKTDNVKVVEEVARWMQNHLPPSPSPKILHNDYKLNNMMMSSKHLSQIVGIFDWEMSTIGDPLTDVGVALGYWYQHDDPKELTHGLKSVTNHRGFISRREFVERYAQKSGRDLTSIHYYVTFAYFKLAVILQQIYYRWKKGQTQDPRFQGFGEVVKDLMEHAHHISKGGHF
jgi:aminoglycoside phosphotransferase (APT) family kinase protein